MTESQVSAEATSSTRNTSRRKTRRTKRLLAFSILGAFLVLGALGAVWIAVTAAKIKTELYSATALADSLRDEIAKNEPGKASETVQKIRAHTAVAADSASQPLWSLAAGLPWIGQNLSAVAEVARTGDDVATLGLAPLVNVYSSLDWANLLPRSDGTNLAAVESASPSVSSAAHAVRLSTQRLELIDTGHLVPAIADPIDAAKGQLQQVSDVLDSAADAVQIAPEMLGSQTTRTYLLMVQNNAEARASGGIPGALAVLTVDKGKLTLGTQSTASDLGVMTPTLPVEPQQRQIYSGRLGKYMQDVNLTPDFPTSAGIARVMWEKKTGQRLDGVISIDPVVLSYILEATGPVALSDPELADVESSGLPLELTGSNVVPTLLSEVYAKIPEPKGQDAYFAGVAKEVFSALSGGKGEAKGIINGITRGTEEGRVLIWSGKDSEQSVISKYSLSGSIAGPSVSPAQFGVYFNDGTGAKMDYYVKRTVQLIKECPADGYEQTTVRITSTNTAPADAASSLPAYVTGGGLFGVTPGSVQTNLVAYGPIQANIESARLDGEKTPFAPYIHATRPVGVIAQQLAPGESKTVEFTFGKIVQHTEPNLVVTPSVQQVKDVTLPTVSASCDKG
ncbi:DUF4012 domain-containing protein [Arthrobacter sp. MAHUQ-56]